MRVLLHTPLKSPDSPIPSGDREMARGLRRLLRIKESSRTIAFHNQQHVPPRIDPTQVGLG